METVTSQKKIQRIELLFRDLCISFCVAAFFISFTKETLPIMKWTVLEIPVILIMLVLFCLPLSKGVRHIVKEPFDFEDEDWTGEEDAKDKWVVFYRYFGLFTLYLVTQLGIATLFFPSFMEYQFFHIPFFIVCFIFNCYCICWLYSRIVFKASSATSIMGRG
jgi:hypothetical protein